MTEAVDWVSKEKDRAGKAWTGRAPYWVKYADDWAHLAESINKPFLDAVGIQEGQTVLDLASGAGEPALSIAKRIGQSGEVYATDLVHDMLLGIWKRAEKAGLKNIHYCLTDMEHVPFGDWSFDRITARFGLMFCPEPDVALAEAYRVLKPRGRIGLMEWGPLIHNDEMRIILDAAKTIFGEDDPDVELDQYFRFGERGSISIPLKLARFVNVVEKEFVFHPKPKYFRGLCRKHAEMVLGNRLGTATPEEEKALDEEIHKRLLGLVDDEGRCRLHVHIRIATGDKI